MIINPKILLATLVLSTSTSVLAKPVDLTESCTELVNIYQSKHKQQLFAAQTTSLSESLRAGYCLGVLTEFAESHYSCGSDWFKRAKFIAAYSSKASHPKERKLLELSCDI
ncbi:hypothetical protein ACVFI8_10900 [Agarivorans sp. MS3-6]